MGILNSFLIAFLISAVIAVIYFFLTNFYISKLFRFLDVDIKEVLNAGDRGDLGELVVQRLATKNRWLLVKGLHLVEDLRL